MEKLVYVQNKQFYEELSSTKELEQKGFSFSFVEKISEGDIIKTLIKDKKNQAIFINEKCNISLVYKYKYSWKFLNTNIFDIYFAEKYGDYKLNTENVYELRKKILSNYMENLDVEGRYLFSKLSKVEIVIKQLDFLVKDNWKNLLDKYSEKISFLAFEKSKYNPKYTEILIKKIKNNESIPGINNIHIISQEESSITFNSGNTLIKISIQNNFTEVFVISTSEDEVSSHYLNKGMNENIRNNILNNKTTSAKIKKRDIFISLIGIVLFLILTIFTFTSIFEPKNIEESFKILFNKKTLIQPWVYLLWLNFFFSFFFPFIIMNLTFYLMTGRMPNVKQIWAFFTAAQLKATARFFTGEAIIGTILWAWYLNRNTNIRTSSLIGAVATLSIIRIPLVILISTPFMIFGQIYAVEVFSSVQEMSGEAAAQISPILFFILAWGGYGWGIIHHSLIPILILLPPAYYLFNIINTRVELFRNKTNIVKRLHNREMSICSIKKSSKDLFKRKDRIYRMIFTIFLTTIIEALEIMYIFKIVENYMFASEISPLATNKANYFNFIQLSGIRLMVRNVYEFPIINITPGNGMAVIEFFMNNTNQAIFLSEHNFINLVNNDQILSLSSKFSQETTFITRFFNTYLNRFISTLITLWIIKSIVVRKLKKISS